MTAVRIITTNDFVGSFFPQKTSYGRLPGAAAVQATVDELRTVAHGALWIDTGDLAQGSALGALSDGAWPFLALGELSIDVAVAGNHELDWGEAHLHRWSAELPFPLLAANLPLGLPATRLLQAGSATVGVIGLSLPSMPALHPGATVHSDSAGLVRAHSAELRAEGASHVVLALHDGADPAPTQGTPRPVTDRIQALCAAVRGHVDLVLGGHTLMLCAGLVAGVPFLQPWAFGSQVGVADLHEDGRVELSTVDVTAARPWTGIGAAAQATLEADIVGHLERALRQADGRERSLAQAIANGLLDSDQRLDAAYIGPGDLWNQPARDGVQAFLDAGDVTVAQVLRLTPLCGARSAWGGQLVATGLSAAEADQVLGPPLAGTVARRSAPRGATTLALSPHNTAAVDQALRRDHDWQPISATLRDGLMAAITR
jgi:hypothetical protein